MTQKPEVRRLASLPKRKAEFVESMDCAPVTKLVDGPQWVYEIKLDGYRAVAVKADRGVDPISLFSTSSTVLYRASSDIAGIAFVEVLDVRHS